LAYSIEKEIEKILETRHLVYNKREEQGLVQYKIHSIGEGLEISLVDNFATLKCTFLEEEDTKKMGDILYRLGWTFKNVTYSKKKVDRLTLFTIDIYPFKRTTFEAVIEDLSSLNGLKEVAQPVQSRSQSPKEFFLNEYRSFKTIPDEEKVNALESILQIKERYFRGQKTLKSIRDRLFKLKEEALEDADNFDLEEFFLLDFAALFRVLELDLLKISLKDFFDNFGKGIRK